MYKEGDRVTWKGMNKTYTGTVVRLTGPFAVVKVDGLAGHVLLQNKEKHGDK